MYVEERERDTRGCRRRYVKRYREGDRGWWRDADGDSGRQGVTEGYRDTGGDRVWRGREGYSQGCRGIHKEKEQPIKI